MEDLEVVVAQPKLLKSFEVGKDLGLKPDYSVVTKVKDFEAARLVFKQLLGQCRYGVVGEAGTPEVVDLGQEALGQRRQTVG